MTAEYPVPNQRPYLPTLIQNLEQNEVSPPLLAELKKNLLFQMPFVAENFNTFQLEDLLNYLESSHAYYLSEVIPRIEQTLDQLFRKYAVDNIPLRILYFFLSRYKTKLIFHIEQEENVLFSFVRDMVEGNYSERAKVVALQHFLHTHNDNIILEVEELKRDLMNVDPELEQNFVFRLLFNQLSDFQNDLILHSHIEDEVFIPIVIQKVEQIGKASNT